MEKAKKTHFKISRREFFWGLLGTIASLFVLRVSRNRPGLSVHQGFTDKTSTILTVLRGEKQNVRYSVYPSDNYTSPIPIALKTSTRYGSSLDQLNVTGLELGKLYTLEIWETDILASKREFRALDTDNSAAKIAVYSCSADEWRVDHAAMWAAMSETKPDLMVSLGDNVYVDGSTYGWGVLWPVYPDQERIWRRYTDMRQNLELYQLKTLIPMIAVWDDHDFGYNGADSNFEHKDYVKSVFESFFPRPDKSENFECGPGVSMMWDAFNIRLLFTDSRYFRTSNVDPATRTQWGSEQKNWLSQRLKSSTTPIWILNGTQFTGGDPKNFDNDSFAMQHPEDLEWLRQQVKSVSPTVTLISGDVHYSEVTKMPPEWGNGVYEITSSALHAIPDTPKAARARLALTDENNFILLQNVTTSSKTTSIKTSCFGSGSKKFFELEITPSK